MSHTITDTTTLLASSRPYTRSGIGGASNTRQITCSSRAPSIPRKISPLNGTFLIGIGGAGNSRSYSERASISFEDALSHNSMHKQSVAGSYHHGMGGIGNRSKPSADAGSSASGSVDRTF
ncbi:hypothetical protein WAI453_005400 [Rhynchosporium graminicola]|uniref:Uncharacterized protein n=1 Tax=Rhynchosporium graminicola TaxID=2792576 RepID=A0A1E1LRY1_9HELO|nr:uncharacterized protein RCO7_05292 [Rhynchosporium commune]